MDKLLVAVASCCLFLGVTMLQLPPYIQKCSIKDTNINSCALNSARQALPYIIKGDGKYNVPILEPLLMSGLTVNNGKLKIVYPQILLSGLKNLELGSIRFDFDKKNITVEGKVPLLKFTGDYKISGKFGAHRIYGSGPFYIPYLDTAFKYTTSYTLYGQDDCEAYLVLQDYHLDLVPASIKIYYGNLFNGNKVLGDEVTEYLNDNMDTVLREVGPQVFDAIGMIIHKIFSQAATTVLYKDIFDDIECGRQ